MLNDEAKNLYLHLTFVSYDYGLINCFEFSSRLQYLSSIIDDQSLKNWLKQFNEFENENRNREDDEMETIFISKNEENDFLISESNQKNNDTTLLAFITAANGVLGEKWRFHQYDPDYYPSIPHGHLATNKRIKLDSYQGFTYDTSANNKSLRREKRKFIINLWNDKKFRIFALTHINYYIVNYPKHNWGVKSRTRLPRKRK